MKPEIIPLVLNIGMLVFYAWKKDEPGKILYWLGAVFLTAGLLRMRG